MRSDLISHAFQMSTDANPKEQVPTSPGNSTEQPDCALKSEGTPANFTEEELQVHHSAPLLHCVVPMC